MACRVHRAIVVSQGCRVPEVCRVRKAFWVTKVTVEKAAKATKASPAFPACQVRKARKESVAVTVCSVRMAKRVDRVIVVMLVCLAREVCVAKMVDPDLTVCQARWVEMASLVASASAEHLVSQACRAFVANQGEPTMRSVRRTSHFSYVNT